MYYFPHQIYVNGVLIARPDMPTDGGVIHAVDGIIRSTVRHCDIKKKNNTYVSKTRQGVNIIIL